MSNIDIAVKGSRELEEMLERTFGATGRGLHEKVDSVRGYLPASLVKKIHWLATIRNKIVHTDEKIRGIDNFAKGMEEAIDELKKIAVNFEAKGGSDNNDKGWIVVLGGILVVIIFFIVRWYII